MKNAKLLKRSRAKARQKARQFKRAIILLKTDEALSDPEIMAALNISRPCDERIRKRFVADGIKRALNEDPKPGQKCKLDGCVEAILIATACTEAPEGYTYWSLRLLAGKLVQLGVVDTVLHDTVRQTLKKNELKARAARDVAVTLAWPDAAIEEEGYTLERSTDGQNWIAVAELSANTLRYVDYGLARHTRYWYRLTAHSSTGGSVVETVQTQTSSGVVNYQVGEERSVSIDNSYDALNRLTSATYDDGTIFAYTYDAAGNTLQAVKTIEGQSVTTVYAYDPDNRLTTAQANGGVVWQYSFDGNGSLVESRPGDQPGSGAKRYSYNCAGQLTRVESHDGTNYQAQAEMVYNGQGQRLALTAYQAGQSLTTAYLLDGNTLLAATADGATTFYLPGVGEYKEVWSYYLSDGTNSARQMVDGQGTVTLTRSSFTPWGELLALSGMGDFTWGYLGGLLDAATGLIYVGNGQYYDPATGRFLSRCKSEFAQPLRALAGQSAGDDSGAAGAARTHPRQAQGREDRSISGTASCYDGRDNNHYWL